MVGAYILFLIPLLLFVTAFLYETLLSFLRLRNPQAGRSGYVHATWEVTHTLLVFTVVMLLMLFTTSIDRLAAAIFTATFLAAVALALRYICYIYIFYVRTKKQTDWVDWTFALSHVAAALLLVTVVVQALWFLIKNKPQANTQFIPLFIPGLVLVLAVCSLPLMFLYFGKHKD